MIDRHLDDGRRRGSLSVRIIREHDLTDGYLPLRYEVLHRELHWTVGDVAGPEQLLDEYDRASIAFGVFRGDAMLLAAARLIEPAGGPKNLPTLRLLSRRGEYPSFAEPVGELSRVMVSKAYRGMGLFKVLLLTGILMASRDGLRTLVVTERESERFAAFMSRHRFKKHATGFSFIDDTIAPGEPAATYVLEITSDFNARCGLAVAAERDCLLSRLEAAFDPGPGHPEPGEGLLR